MNILDTYPMILKSASLMKSKSIRSTILFLMLLIISALPAAAQDIVVVAITPPAPNQLSIADLWRVDLINPGRITLDVYLVGTIESGREGLAGEARTSAVPLQPGANRFTGRELEPVRITYSTPRYRSAMTRTGSFPAGSYTLCVIAFEVLSDRELGRDCIQHDVQPFSPPQLVSPLAGDEISMPYPVFVWTPLAPAPADGIVRYRIKLVQVLRSQAPEVAAQSNRSWFELQNLMQTSLPYPANARPLEEGTYAWFVEATGIRTGEVLAHTEVGVFTWKPPQLEIRPGIIATIAPHGIPLPLFEALMKPCTGTPANLIIPKPVIEKESN
jgi:hypothetical protein